jgi:hypothetical protein
VGQAVSPASEFISFAPADLGGSTFVPPRQEILEMRFSF